MAGIAAATAISSARSRNKSFAFETIPAVRKRQATRLVRKLQNLIEEYTVRVGQQAIVLICNPRVAHKVGAHLDSPSISTVFKVYGSSPLENVIRNMRPIVTQELDTALRNFQILHEQAGGSSSLWSGRGPDTLPPLMVDGIPTPLDKMTQAQLRAFIPVMLKYSTNRGKPGWGRPHARPPWWPDEVPWANVRSDVRTTEEKAQVSWTAALKKVVRMCYEYHGRDDLLADYAHQDNSNVGVVNSTQLMDIDGSNNVNVNAPSFMMSSRSLNEVNEQPHNNVYNLGVMHMPTAEGIQTQNRYTPYQAPPSYSFKTEKDGSISIIRINDNQKLPEVASMEAAATLEEYNVENVKFTGNEDMNIQPFSNGGDMVSLPAETMMQLDNDATAALYHIIANNSRRKQSQMGNSPIQNNNRNNENM
uniref:DNA-binding protein P3A2 (Trinotate prediction) n=1 Tax=Myxobolus squamalis TaxID=59785 RepID=A0A6B2FWT5_MYXSQ